MPTLIEVYSDGSGNTFASDGGFGWRVVVDGVNYCEGSGYLPSATNNVAELSAAIEGLREVARIVARYQWNTHPKVVLVSDSQLVLGYASGKYKCKAEHLKPLHEAVQKEYNALKADVRWVKGHAGDEHNEAVDKLAGAARKGKGVVA